MKKKKSLLKITAVALAILCVLPLGACGDKNGEPSDTSQLSSAPTQSNAEENSTKETDTGADANTDKYDPAISLSFIGQLNDQFEKTTLVEGITLEDNLWTDLYEERLGIDITYDWIAKSPDEYSQKLNLSLSSGNIPDIMKVDALQLQQCVKAGIIQPLDGLLEKYGSDRLKDMFNTYDFDPFIATQYDGQTYALPYMWAISDNPSSILWLRADWMKNLNIDPPQTIDDLMEISRRFTHEDPDGNGADDTYGFALNSGFFEAPGGLEGIFEAYGLYPKTWLEQNGELVYGSIQPGVKEVLGKIADLYADGQLDPEFYVKTMDKVTQDMAANKLGIMYGQMWNAIWPLTDSRVNDENVDWAPYLLPGEDGPIKKLKANSGIDGYYVVSKDCENPEALIKMMNLYMEMDAYPEEYYNSPEGKELWKLSPISAPELEAICACTTMWWKPLRRTLRRKTPSRCLHTTTVKAGRKARILECGDSTACTARAASVKAPRYVSNTILIMTAGSLTLTAEPPQRPK